MIQLDGGRGEGGGQILRTALALSILTKKPLRMHRVRAGRAKPGLRRQHLACVAAAARLSGARTVGASVGSQELEFVPWETAPEDGPLMIDIGSAGSTSLVVQTILMPAILAGRALSFSVQGGTHNPMAPPFDFLDRVFVPHLRAMGADVEISLDRHGFATGGAQQASHDDVTPHRGQLTVRVGPGRLAPIELLEHGPVVRRRAVALLARLPTHVGDRELGRVRERLGFARDQCEAIELQHGETANVLTIEVEHSTGGRELVTAFGEKGLRAEAVADRACDEMAAFLGANVPVGEHLADQLLLPFALAGGGAFRSAPLSLHATTNIETIRAFLDVAITVEQRERDAIVRVGAPA